MKYIKKYEIITSSSSSKDTIYKDGDIVFIDIDSQIVFEKDKKAIEFLEKIKPIQMIHTDRDGYYYINDENWYRNFYIEPVCIDRLANANEINEYLLRKNIKKYNV